jgi:hypothetical protein
LVDLPFDIDISEAVQPVLFCPMAAVIAADVRGATAFAPELIACSVIDRLANGVGCTLAVSNTFGADSETTHTTIATGSFKSRYQEPVAAKTQWIR